MTYVCCACDHDSVVVRPWCSVRLLTRRIRRHARTVENLSITRQDRALGHPVKGLLCPSRIRVVARVHGKSGSKVEKTSIRGSVFVCPTVEPWIDLPAHATTTIAVCNLLLVTADKLVKDGLRNGEPTRLITRRIWELVLGSSDHGKGPEYLVVVSLVLGLV